MTLHDDTLEDLFRAARATPPVADSAFLARVLGDALAAQPAAPQVRPAPQRGLWTRIAAALGGAVAVAGLGTAAMAGLVIGYVQPEPMLTLAGSFGMQSAQSLDLFPGVDGLLTEDLMQ
ncbi:MAG: dihydroorotate dehydrogenase [Rhodobacteraceae bacterium]|nr:dihydroorotate dehydrogenase [Paracoccaceae bacterium]